MIQRNLHNPLPLHRSIEDWYDNKKTCHGACNHIYAPNGYLLPIQLTLSEEEVPMLNVGFRLSSDSGTTIYTGSPTMSDGGVITLTSGTNSLVVAKTTTGYTISFTFTGEHSISETYTICKDQNSTKSVFAEADLRLNNTMRDLYAYDSSNALVDGCHIMGNLLSPTINCTATLVRLHDGSRTSIVGLKGNADIVPSEFRTDNKYATMYLGGKVIIRNMPDEIYYLEVGINGTTYFTEPFAWLTDTDDLVRIIYRRSVPIVTNDNYIPFVSNGRDVAMDMYLRCVFEKPQYSWDNDVQERDGYNFVKKQVSYFSHNTKILCSAYFAEAMRVMWHCDERAFSDGGEVKIVDYMEAPDPSWDADNHLCEISISFRTDTICQTNSTATYYTAEQLAQSFDESFDNSFN